MHLAIVLAVVTALATVPGAAGSLPAVAQQDGQTGSTEVVRYAGANRFGTARRIATEEGVGAPDFGGDTALVARADAFPDSLAGSYLAGVLDAPVLLTQSDRVIEPFEDALAELAPSNLVLLGGQAAISQEVEQILAQSYNVIRVAGDDRYETAAEIARHSSTGDHPGLALLASGEDFPDALTAGAVAAGEEIPMLLTAQGTLPQPTADALQDLDVDEVVLTGGSAAVSDAVQQQVENLGIRVTRVFGSNRFATARAIGELATDRFGWRTDHVNLTNGLRFPDAVTLAAHAGLEAGGPAPIALTAQSLPAPTEQWLSDLAACDFARLDIAGGTAAVPDDVERAAVDALRPDGCSDDADPEVSVTSPDDGATVMRGQDGVELRGTARDDASGVRKVEIFVGDQLVGATTGDRSTSDPLEWAVTVFPPETGTFTFRAVATDGAGRTSSDTVTVTVEGRDPSATVVGDDVHVVGDGVVDYDPDSGRITLQDQPADDPVEAGDPVVSGTTSAAPEGFLRRVVTVRENEDGEVVLETVVGHLTDVFRQLDTRLHAPVDLSAHTDDDPSDDGVTLTRSEGLPPSDVSKLDVTEGPRSDFPSFDSPATASTASSSQASSPASARTLAGGSISKVWTLTFDKTIEGDNASLTVNGRNEFGIGVEFRVHIETDFDWFNTEVRLERFRLVGQVTEDARLSAAAEANFDAEETVELLRTGLPSINFQVGPVPVVINSDLVFDLQADVTVDGEATASAHGHLELAAGTKFRHGEGFQPVNRFERSWNTDPLTFRGSADARADLRAGLDVRLWDTGGTDIRVGPYVAVEAADDREPLWTLFGGLAGTAQLVAEIPVINARVESDELDLFEQRVEIASAQDFPSHTPNEPDPPAVTITSPSEDTVGCCEVLLRADTDSPRREDDESMPVDYRSDRDGDLATGFGQDPVRVTLSPGSHTITAEVSEFVDGEEVTATDEITVEVQSDRRPSEQFVVSSTAGADQLSAGLLGLAMEGGGEVYFDGAEFLSAPPTDGFAGIVENVPGSFDDQNAVILSTGLADDADTANEADEDGTDLGGDAVRGDSDRDVVMWALHLSIPEHANCLTFDHRFLSEEVPRFVGSEYNDAFVAEIFERDQGQASAPDDAPDWTVSGSELSAPESFALGPEGRFNTQVNASTGLFVTPSNAFQTTYQSGHPRMRAATPVTPGSEQTLVLSLFDQGDARYDSAVLLNNLSLVQVPDPESDCASGIARDGLALTTSLMTR